MPHFLPPASRARIAMALRQGVVVGVEGAVVRGKWPLIQLETGAAEELDVVIATGALPGPKLLLTGNIHGNEVNPCVILHRIIEWLETAVAAGGLVGTVVIWPSLNPSGHRAGTRSASFDRVDPNRVWPDPFESRAERRRRALGSLAGDRYAAIYAERSATGPVEECWARLMDVWRGAGFDYHCDLHTAMTLSHPFIFVDRVLYRGEAAAAEAAQLWQRVRGMCGALGLSLVVEDPAEQYVKARLHRSTSGAVLQGLRCPAVTIECGGMDVAEPSARDATVAALHNLMRHAGMEAGPVVPQRIVPAHLHLDNLHRKMSYPRMPCTGIVDFVLKAGDAFVPGDLMLVVRSMDGRKLGEVRAEYNGFIVGWPKGVAFQQGQPLGSCAMPDGLPMIADYDKSVKPAKSSKL